MPSKPFPGPPTSTPPSPQIPMVLWMVDQGGVLQLVEGNELPCLDLEKSEIIGRSIHELYDHAPGILDAIQKALKGETVQGDLTYQGKTWTYRTYPSLESGDQITGAVGLAFDITDQQKRIRHLEMTKSLSAALDPLKGRDEMPPVILSEIRECFNAQAGALISLSKRSNDLVLENSQGSWDQLGGELSRLQDLSPLEAMIDLIFDNGQPLTQSYPRQSSPPNLSVEHIAGAPLTGESQVTGTLLITRPYPFTETEISLLTDLCDLAGNALCRALQHQRTERRLQRISALHAIDRAITGSFDLRVTLEVLLNQVISQLEIDAVDVYLYNADMNTLDFASSRGFQQPPSSPQQLHPGRGLPWQAVAKRNLLHFPDLTEAHAVLERGYLTESENFVSYFGFPLIVKGEIKGVLEIFHRQLLHAEEEWTDFYKTLATQAAIAIDNATLVEDLRRSNLKLDQAYHATLEGWVRALDLRDKETEGHTQRVTKWSERLAASMGISGEALTHLRRGALLHDIGKLGIPDEILNKPGPLTDDEMALMKNHPEYARKMLSQIEFLHPALVIPTHHHEKWDGSGYPQGLQGTEIPLEARIFAVIDVWDALTSQRPYRAAWPEDKAIRYILNQSGKHFDPAVVDAWKVEFNISERLEKDLR